MAASGDITEKRCTKCGEVKSIAEFNAHRRVAHAHPWCRRCKRASSAADYAKNRAARAEKRAAYRTANAERAKIYAAAYYQANRPKMDAINAAWARSNPEKRRAMAARDYYRHREQRLAEHKAWREANRDIVAALRDAYRAKNRELIAALKRNYKARKRAAAGTHTGADITAILTAQNGRCAMCRVRLRGGYHVDHVTPLIKGGSNGRANLQLLCPPCNLSKKDKDPLAFARERGLLL